MMIALLYWKQRICIISQAILKIILLSCTNLLGRSVQLPMEVSSHAEEVLYSLAGLRTPQPPYSP
jgi:hypothetical protein